MHFCGTIAAAAPPSQWTDKKGNQHMKQQFMLTSKEGDKIAFIVFKDADMAFFNAHIGCEASVTLEFETYWHREKAMWYNNVRCTGIEDDNKDIGQEQEELPLFGPQPVDEPDMHFQPTPGDMPAGWFGNPATATRRRPGRPRLAKRG